MDVARRSLKGLFGNGLGALLLLLLLAAARADATGSINLAWDAVTTPPATGYKIYYGPSLGNYPSHIDVGNVTSYTVSGLTEGSTYHFVATAYDASSVESGFSNDVSGTVAFNAPVAQFTGSPTSGAAPLSVNFTNTSTGSITSYAWTFGDAGTSTLQSPSHAYAAPGTYSVSLTVSGPGGNNTQTRTNYITASFGAPALLNRTAVSVAGNDANTCAIATPCRTIGRAISQTNSGGEVVVVDSAGYGPFTVDRAITIEAAPGVYAGITAGAAGTNAVQISAGASDVVVLRGLTINGMGTASAGIAFIGGGAEAHVENCVITGFVNWGIISFFPIRVQDTIIRHSGIGIHIDNAGTPVNATIERVQLQHNGYGLIAWRNARVTARDSVAAYNANAGFWARQAGFLTLENVMASANGTGVSADLFGTSGGTVRLSNAFVVQNDTGVLVGAGIVETWTNNKIVGNTVADVSGSMTTIATK